LEEKLKMFEMALKELIASMKEKEEVPAELLERIDRVERKVDILTRILTEWLPAKFLEEMKTLGLEVETKPSVPVTSPETKPVTPTTQTPTSTTPVTPEPAVAPVVEPTIPKPSGLPLEEVEMLREELTTIERQIADLEFQKDSGFITKAEYEKKKRELEAKKKEIETRIKGT